MLRLFPYYVRYFSIKQAAKPPITFTNTINLPKTKFANRLSAAKRLETEHRLVEGIFSEAYSYQETHNNEPAFVLHDGPPYANGDLHMGHAVNKILKDITIRRYVTLGQKVHYIPGWDCHGLPIELKATTCNKNNEENTQNQNALSIRKKSRDFALKAIQRQKDEFRSWGILSDWLSEENTYLTMRSDFIVNQLKMFLDFYERGLVYRDLKPVYWSPSSRSALAEAELEYDTNFVSPSVYVRFLLTNTPCTSKEYPNTSVYALVWTTTPWTLPSNQGICYNSSLEYSLVTLHNSSDKSSYLIATSLLQNFSDITGCTYEVLETLRGTELSNCTYQHPFNEDQRSLPFYNAAHVQETKGTGLVHTAPAHGPEDFLIGLENKLPVISNIKVYPRIQADASRKTLMSQVQRRPYWCISRQRVWGVPIPVFYERSTKKIFLNKTAIEHICKLIENEGNIDFWWSKNVEELLPAAIMDQLNMRSDDLEKSVDIFDIWFDSGSTWSSVLKDEKVADVYLEGYDQFSGWFQSSLLTSIAARDKAPYKSIFVHGFAVDDKGRKMSKSLGNVISPNDVIKKYGVDVLRWWVASHGAQNMSITVSEKLMQQSADSVSKVRAILRYLNGVVGEKKEEDNINVPEKEKLCLNSYLLNALITYDNEITQLYNACEYNRVVTTVQNFVTNQISAIYVHTIKDRLYCGDDADLKNIRLTLLNCYKILCKTLWPLTPFLVEESWGFYDAKSAFHQQKIASNPVWKDTVAERAINVALEVKRLINQQAGNTYTFNLAVEILYNESSEKMQLLRTLQKGEPNIIVSDSELCELLQVQSVTLRPSNSSDMINVKVEKLNLKLCARCRRFAVDSVDCVCTRCVHILSNK
ncbi:isoleucine--tRNA ligase, mitochondrial isoform X2 [Eurosta solidaginis]|uniref:isoleucine--tRNA ligase, mitochondrial isoform X2 n=1 Tax=Eurosta solidaginis TaxID=178769 RepID=UPI003530FBF2